MNEWLINPRVIAAHSYVCHGLFMSVPWLIRCKPRCRTCNRRGLLSYVCRDSCACVPWLIRMCAMTHFYVCHDTFIEVPWLIHAFATTHSYVCHDSLISVSWLIRMCAMTHSCMCAMTHSCVCHDSFIYVPWVMHTSATTLLICVPWLIRCKSRFQTRTIGGFFLHLWHDSFISMPRHRYEWVIRM